MKKMGSLEQIIEMLPGVKPGAMKDAKIDEKQMPGLEAIIKSMTKQERMKPDIINASRKKRIAAGSGTKVEDVNKLLKNFEETQRLMKQFMSGGKKGRFGKKMKLPF